VPIKENRTSGNKRRYNRRRFIFIYASFLSQAITLTTITYSPPLLANRLIRLYSDIKVMYKKKNTLWSTKSKLSAFLVIYLLIVPIVVPSFAMAAAGGCQYSIQDKQCEPNGSSACQTQGCEDPAIKCSNNQCDLIKKYVNPVINLLASLFGVVAVASIILGGIQYTTSEGDPQKSSNAKKRLTNTIFAILAFIFLYAFLQFLIPGGIFNRPTSG